MCKLICASWWYCASCIVQADMCKLYCASCSVQAVLCKLICASCIVQADMCKLYCASWWYCASCIVQADMCKLYCASCIVQVGLYASFLCLQETGQFKCVCSGRERCLRTLYCATICICTKLGLARTVYLYRIWPCIW